MARHRPPGTLEILSARLQLVEVRNTETTMGTLLVKDIVQHRGRGPRFRVPVKIDHIVEIARPGTVAEGADLFGERFLVGVAEDDDSLFGCVAVVVENGGASRAAGTRRLIGSQIEFDAWEAAGARRDRTPVAELSWQDTVPRGFAKISKS